MWPPSCPQSQERCGSLAAVPRTHWSDRGVIARRPPTTSQGCADLPAPASHPGRRHLIRRNSRHGARATLIDLAGQVPTKQLEAAIKEADSHGLVGPDALRRAAERAGRARGAGRLRAVLDLRVFALTDSELERRFLPLSQHAGLPKPLTGASVAGYRSDFYWPDLGLVVETDGLRYHRTPSQQGKDHERDQAYAAAGLTALRFTHAQVEFEPDRVVETLRAVGTRLLRRAA
jgi:hypothetical protein